MCYQWVKISGQCRNGYYKKGSSISLVHKNRNAFLTHFFLLLFFLLSLCCLPGLACVCFIRMDFYFFQYSLSYLVWDGMGCINAPFLSNNYPKLKNFPFHCVFCFVVLMQVPVSFLNNSVAKRNGFLSFSFHVSVRPLIAP